MRQWIPGKLFVLAALALSTCACGSLAAAIAASTAPAATTTETFSGTLNINGAVAYSFALASAGSINATLSTVGPDATIPVGVSMGTWNGTACAVVIDNPNAQQGATMTGNATTAGNFCIRLYDAGKLTTAATFSISVVHP